MAKIARVFRYAGEWAALTLVVLTGCDRTDDGASFRRSCAAFCNRLESCDDDTDRSECVDECLQREFVSGAFVSARAQCSETLSCNLWQAEVDSQGVDACTGADCELQACVRDAVDDLELSPAAEEQCADLASKIVACDRSGSTRDFSDHCESVTPLLSESYLQESHECVRAQCFEIQSCLGDLAKDYDADIRIVPESWQYDSP